MLVASGNKSDVAIHDNPHVSRERALYNELVKTFPDSLCDMIRAYSEECPAVFKVALPDGVTHFVVSWPNQESANRVVKTNDSLSSPNDSLTSPMIPPTVAENVKRFELATIYTAVAVNESVYVGGSLYINNRHEVRVLPVSPLQLKASAKANTLTEDVETHRHSSSTPGYTLDYPPAPLGYVRGESRLLLVSVPRKASSEGDSPMENTAPFLGANEEEEEKEEDCVDELWMARTIWRGKLNATQIAINDIISCTELWRYRNRKWVPVFDHARQLETLFVDAAVESPYAKRVITCDINKVGNCTGGWMCVPVVPAAHGAFLVDYFLCNPFRQKVIKLHLKPLLISSIACPLSRRRRGLLYPHKDKEFLNLFTNNNNIGFSPKTSSTASRECQRANCAHDGILMLSSLDRKSFGVAMLDCDGHYTFCTFENTFDPSHLGYEKFTTLGFDRKTQHVLVSYANVIFSYSLQTIIDEFMGLDIHGVSRDTAAILCLQEDTRCIFTQSASSPTPLSFL